MVVTQHLGETPFLTITNPDVGKLGDTGLVGLLPRLLDVELMLARLERPVQRAITIEGENLHASNHQSPDRLSLGRRTDLFDGRHELRSVPVCTVGETEERDTAR